jgi:hypothetical protein
VEEPEHQEGAAASSRRGEAAWKDNLERIAERNAKAKKEGKQRRQAYERQKDEARRRRELRQLADLPGRRAND